jgi:hypothetical protein
MKIISMNSRRLEISSLCFIFPSRNVGHVSQKFNREPRSWKFLYYFSILSTQIAQQTKKFSQECDALLCKVHDVGVIRGDSFAHI